MGKLTHIRRSKMLAQGGRCYYCNLPMWDPGPWDTVPESSLAPGLHKYLRCTAEHLLPRSEGGGNAPGNIVAACWFCNNTRHRSKIPLSPKAYRALVRQRMAKGKWLAAMVPRTD